ncbi:TonB-dependent receptor [Sphingomonas gilva]|uniref:TonB-dependent receptor n=2 Tax=Sphingomonas gilva TaxID=2305907 RepID=A0A396RWN9_9SPHN|nr:TonB-dependent receptor [Sphingomonas gilva]RHW18131.1 TonB-dependent receptor [Sphingomonas gilva]
MLLACAAPAQAGDVRPINLPAGKLGDAVAALGRQAGVSVSVPDRAIWRARVPAVRGEMTVRQALDRLLAGTNARAVALDARSWRIARAPPRASRPAPPPPAPPPPAEEPPEADIIVVASKRETTFGGYAGQVSRVEGEDLALGAPAGTEAVATQVASVTSTHFGAGRNKLFVRGIADSSFTGPTQATVGQYFGDVRLTYNAPDPGLKLLDVAAVEVLEGPQGTLYGAGSLGGIIRVTRNAPQLQITGAEIGGGVSFTEHGEAGGDLSGVINLPLVEDAVALRAVGYLTREGGYIDDAGRGIADVNRTDIHGGRVMLRLAPGDDWTIDIGATLQDIDARDSQYADRDAPELARRSSIAQPYSDQYRLAELVIAKQWDDLRFVSSTGYVRQTVTERFDATTDPQEPRAFDQINEIELISTENRLARPMDEGYGWILGMSLLRNESELRRAIGPIGEPRPATGVRNRIDEATLYAEASVEPVRGLTLSAGGRVTHSRLSGEGLDVGRMLNFADRQMQADRDETTVLPSVSIVAEPIADVSLFARYQEGFRPGGLAVSDDFIRQFANDEVRSIETGVRYGVPGVDGLTLAATFAYTRWNNIQADFVDGAGLPTTANIGNGRIYSWDFRLGWRPLPGLSLDAGFVVNDGEITDPQPAFRLATLAELPNVAETGGRFGFDWRTFLSDTVDLRVAGWARYIGKSRLGVGPILGGPQGDYVDTGLTARIGFGRYGVTLGATNLTDSVGNRFSLGSPFDLFRADAITPLRPRTFRIGLDTRF